MGGERHLSPPPTWPGYEAILVTVIQKLTYFSVADVEVYNCLKLLSPPSDLVAVEFIKYYCKLSTLKADRFFNHQILMRQLKLQRAGLIFTHKSIVT